MKTKLFATATHCLIALIVLIFLTMICWFFWYPGALFFNSGGLQGIKLTLLFTLIPFPLLTFIIFKPQKKGLIFDLIVIATLHITVLSFASYTLHEERPQLFVISGNSIHTFTKLEAENLGYHFERDTQWVYVDLPLDHRQIHAIEAASLLIESKALETRSDLYIPIEHWPTPNSDNDLQSYLTFFMTEASTGYKTQLISRNIKTPILINKETMRIESIN